MCWLAHCPTLVVLTLYCNAYPSLTFLILPFGQPVVDSSLAKATWCSSYLQFTIISAFDFGYHMSLNNLGRHVWILLWSFKPLGKMNCSIMHLIVKQESLLAHIYFCIYVHMYRCINTCIVYSFCTYKALGTLYICI